MKQGLLIMLGLLPKRIQQHGPSNSSNPLSPEIPFQPRIASIESTARFLTKKGGRS